MKIPLLWTMIQHDRVLWVVAPAIQPADNLAMNRFPDHAVLRVPGVQGDLDAGLIVIKIRDQVIESLGGLDVAFAGIVGNLLDEIVQAGLVPLPVVPFTHRPDNRFKLLLSD